MQKKDFPISRMRILSSSPYEYTLVLAVFIVMILELVAVFNNGAYFIGTMTLVAVGLWLMVLIFAYTNRFNDLMPFYAGTAIAIIALTAFWVWNGFSVTWSITTDLTWTEFNRTGSYLAVLLIGLAAGKNQRARKTAAFLFLIVATLASIYGVGAKALPSLIDNLEELSRVSVPIGYVNAQGLIASLAYPFALYFATSKPEPAIIRIISTISAPILLLNLFVTLSRGALFALIMGLIMFFVITPARLRSFGVMMLSAAPVIITANWISAQSFLMEDEVALDLRELSAKPLRLYILLTAILVGVVFIISLLVGRLINFSKRITQWTGAALLVCIVSILIVSTALFVHSKSSFTGWVDQSYKEISTTRPDQGVSRLINFGVRLRWQIWQESLDSWANHKVMGSGAQSFPVIHVLEKDSEKPFVKQPHGLPFRILSELGLVGMLFAGVFITLSTYLSTRLLFLINDRWQRSLSAAFLTEMMIYLVHTVFDWDWNVMAVTLPYFLFTGMMLGWYESIRKGRMETSDPTDANDMEVEATSTGPRF